MAVVDELACGEDGRDEFRAVDHGIEPALQQGHQILARGPARACRLCVDAAELTLADIAVVALEPLLGHELGAVFGRLAPALAMLARAVFAIIEWALGPATEIDLQAAIDLVFGFSALRHVAFSRVERLWFMSRVSGPVSPAA